jgi:SAM-dependent methyltransferase
MSESQRQTLASDIELAQILRCPITHGELRVLSADELARINQQIACGDLRHRDGSPVQGVLQGGYQTLDGQLLYGVRESIALLLPALAIVPDSQCARQQPTTSLRQEKHVVQSFYDEVGWVENDDGVFTDAELFEDLRNVVAEYAHNCHMRVRQHLPVRGRYLLDAASGPVQYPEYVAYSENYETRICVDLSYAALRAARGKLGARGVYLLADVTNLPLQTGAIDAAVSLHTIYHVPADEQAQAFRELGRVLQAGGRAAVVYVWKTPLMRAALLPARLAQLPWRLAVKLLRAFQRRVAHANRRRLHFHAHSHRWFVEQDWPFAYRIHCWRSVTVAVTKCYVHGWLLGRMALRLLFRLEQTYPGAFGRWGAYPLIVIEKPIPPALDDDIRSGEAETAVEQSRTSRRAMTRAGLDITPISRPTTTPSFCPTPGSPDSPRRPRTSTPPAKRIRQGSE